MTSGKQHSVILMTYFDKSGDGIPDGTKGLAVRPSPVRVRVRVGIGGGVDVASDFRDDFFLVTLRMIFVLSRFLLRSSPVLGTEAASRTEPQCLIAFLADERFFSFGSLLYFPSFSLLLFLSLFCSFLFFSSAFLPSFFLFLLVRLLVQLLWLWARRTDGQTGDPGPRDEPTNRQSDRQTAES